MSPGRNLLLHAYRLVTKRARSRALGDWSLSGAAPACVLFYHRIADTHPNGWTMSVSMFERQIDWLAERFDFVSLREAQRRLLTRTNHRPSITITFDDGYGENCEHAIPLLLRREIPFTYFVSTQIVRDQSAFPHDLKAGIRLRPNTIEELRAMAEAGVDIGAHTRTHPDLGKSIDSRWLEEEINGSFDDLAGWTGQRPTSFAFPFGQTVNMTPQAMAVAKAAGAQAICSAYGAYNLPEQISDPHGALHVRRIHADPEWSRFANWMTFDPRKLAAIDPIHDSTYLSEVFDCEAELSEVALV